MALPFCVAYIHLCTLQALGTCYMHASSSWREGLELRRTVAEYACALLRSGHHRPGGNTYYILSVHAITVIHSSAARTSWLHEVQWTGRQTCVTWLWMLESDLSSLVRPTHRRPDTRAIRAQCKCDSGSGHGVRSIRTRQGQPETRHLAANHSILPYPYGPRGSAAGTDDRAQQSGLADGLGARRTRQANTFFCSDIDCGSNSQNPSAQLARPTQPIRHPSWYLLLFPPTGKTKRVNYIYKCRAVPIPSRSCGSCTMFPAPATLLLASR